MRNFDLLGYPSRASVSKLREKRKFLPSNCYLLFK